MKTKDCPWLVLLALAVFISLIEFEAQGKPISTESKEETNEIIMERVSIVGTTQRVKDLSTSYPKGRHYNEDLARLTVEGRDPPKACGVRTARFFRAKVSSRFGISSLNNCLISEDFVDCSTEYLPDYPKVYFSLAYQRNSKELEVSLKIQHRGGHGETLSGEVTHEHVMWFEQTFDCLVSVTACDQIIPF
ncbi:MAG: hypothetical protein H0X47_10075, partial [Nitrospirales bacterium]|nr:hypothetical protein [Nitrospirales bacterium]